ncbi:MAG: SMP-30/gluconolactonase/LRE family protein [Beijerinckiaceae bacterium]|nr:SMP-30/gluconolactonase/LRE family protein [Beijerinckiaceae bacterium]
MRIWRSGAEVGEGPFWDEASQSLFWIDIRRPALHRYDVEGRALGSWPLPEPVGAFALLADGERALVALASGLALLDLPSGELERLFDPEPERPENRLNEGKISPCGQFFVFGSMDEREPKQATGSLYRLAADGRVATLARDLVVANGVAWSPDGGTLYFSDSRAAIIWAADWDASVGAITNRRVFATPSADQGRPDGAAMDDEGCYWSAGVSTGRLNRFAPDGALLESIPLPVQAPTMPAFGPPGTLFVTSHRRIAEPKADDGAIILVPTSRSGPRPPRFSLRVA